MSRPLRLASLWTVLLVLVFAQSATSQFQPLETAPSFIVTGADSSLHSEARAILARAAADLKTVTGIGISDTVRVVFVPAERSFDSVIGGRFPDWGVAAAVGERNLIAMRSPADHPIGRSLAEILRHELAHLHLDAMLKLRHAPRWLHEGYAQQFAHEWRWGDDWIVARAVFTKQVLPLRDIDGVNSFKSANAQLAYAQSYLAVGFLISSYGWPGLVELAQALSAGESWDPAFRIAIGADYDGFQKEFSEHLNEKYNWASFLGDTVLLWLGLSALFVLLYLIKRYRTARKKRQWEEEEAIADALYSPFGEPDPRYIDDTKDQTEL